jgi:nucleoside-diphosphate-sugar epimerase
MPMELYGGGRQVSDMVYVGDVAEVLVTALLEAAAGNVLDKAVEVGSVEHTTILDIAQKVNEIMDEVGKPRVPIKSLPMRPGEKEGVDVTADTGTLKLVGYNPDGLTPLDKGLRKTVQYFIDVEGQAWQRP